MCGDVTARVERAERTLAELRLRATEVRRTIGTLDERLQDIRIAVVASEKDRERLESERQRIAAELEAAALEAGGLAGEDGAVAGEIEALAERLRGARLGVEAGRA